MLSLLLLSLVAGSFGVDHDLKWTITGEPFERCIAPGDKLTFNWDGGHNVEKVDKKGYENCSGFNNTEAIPGTGPHKYEFIGKNKGKYYFVCGVGGHCEFGNQKAIVTVRSNC